MSYLHFLGESTPLKQVTSRWRVTNAGADNLGIVKWFAPWRRYVFIASQFTLFDAACMLELAEFCQAKTEEQKTQRKAAKSKDEGR